MLPWPNVPSKWADRLGQVRCQYGTFAKLRTSCPCEVELEVVLFFFEGDWYVHRIAVWECFDIGTWTRRISSRFGALEHEANRTPDMSATFIGSRKKFCERNRTSVCPARKQKATILPVSSRLDRFNRFNRKRTTALQILCQNMVRTWYVIKRRISLRVLNFTTRKHVRSLEKFKSNY